MSCRMKQRPEEMAMVSTESKIQGYGPISGRLRILLGLKNAMYLV